MFNSGEGEYNLQKNKILYFLAKKFKLILMCDLNLCLAISPIYVSNTHKLFKLMAVKR